MLLLIDNYDSFVYNLSRYVGRLGIPREVVRNDAIEIEEIRRLRPLGIILSPGPCAPEQAGICLEIVKALGEEVPILGVCLGHQCIGQAYGARVHRALRPVHGQTSLIEHDGRGVFAGMPQPLEVARYHSLIVDCDAAPALEVSARSLQGEVMALRHRSHPVIGVQFHPESILMQEGARVIEGFVSMAQQWHAQRMNQPAFVAAHLAISTCERAEKA